ncbi:MAG: aminodeoxychorismate lyase [Lacisediminihabitans sp.]
MSAATLILVTRPVREDAAEQHPGLVGGTKRQHPGFVVADPDAPQLSMLDLGATRGDGIFESIGVTNGRMQALEAHLDRFAHSARMLDLPQPDPEVWRRAILAAVEIHAPVPELFVKLVLTRGIEGQDSPTAWVYAEEVGDLSAARTLGIRVVMLDRGYRHDVAQTSPWLLQGAKTLSYAVNRAALREAARRGADDVIFLSSDGYLLEGPTSTLILRHGDRIRTPQTDQGVLAGTTQESAFGFFAARGLETSYAIIPATELETADAAWLVSSVRQAAPLRSADGHPIPVDADLTARLNEYLLARTE